jgi:PAS domain S-box-containing protein
MSNQDARKIQAGSGSVIESKRSSTNEVGALEESKAELAKLSLKIDQQARFFDAILSSISDFAYLFDKQGRFLFVNQALLDLWGLKLEEAVGKDFFDLKYPDELAGRLQRQIQQVFDSKQRVKDETPYTSPTGVVGYYEYIFSPVLGADGSVELVVGTTRNVTERKQNEEKIKQLSERNRDILESINDAFFAVDSDWRFTYVNPQAERLFDRRPGDLPGKVIWQEYPGLLGSEFEKAYRRAADERLASTVTAFYPDHGRWYEVHTYPAPNGITIYFRNVTERLQVEEALRESDRRKDEFLATLAHELRNPLAPIRSGLEIIRRIGDDKARLAETLDIMERQTNQIVHLVDDLLDISRITQGKIKLRKERIELKESLEIALETSQGLIDEAENELTVTFPYKPIYIDADRTRMAQIFLNILNNAAKYSNTGGKISLAASKEGKQAVIRIKDTGLGIPPDMLHKIFDMFGQIETPGEQARGGLGIGLSIVKRLVEMHGGTIQAFSEGRGKGSEFVVRLPLAAEQSESVPARQASEKDILQTVQMKMPDKGKTLTSQLDTGKRRILVVDDNTAAAEMLETLLSIEGHAMRTAFDGKTGIEIAKGFQPDICLLDIGLPDIDGYELARRLRQLLPQSLLISVSGWGREEDRRLSREAGVDYHLVKPVDFDDLLKLIQQKPTEEAQ